MKNSNKKIQIENNQPERLDVFLSAKLKTTRSQIQKLIDNDLVTINGKTATKTGALVRPTDKIIVNKPVAEKKLTVKEAEIKKEKFKINIIKETPDYLVVEKPYGLLTHSTDKNEPDSLASMLAKKYPGLKKVGDDPKRPGIVHRLDKEASGLLVVARTQKMFEHLKDQFKNRTVQKEYSVLAHGKTSKDFDEINFPLERGRNIERMSALPATEYGRTNPLGKEALTEFDVEKRFINFTLLKVKIHTGRMHQIRAHLLAYNHPVVGDPLYKQKKRKDKWDKVCGRLFLHCTKLGFVDLNGEKQEFTSTLPQPLANFLLLLK